MRLGLKLLNIGASKNAFQTVTEVKIARGETVELFIQLVDLDQKGIRYVPDAGATVKVTIPRADQILPTVNHGRERVNKTIERQAVKAFAGDDSVWKIALPASETATLVSNSIKVELTEGSNVKIASLTQAIKIINDYEG